jgi:hypothetical protein
MNYIYTDWQIKLGVAALLKGQQIIFRQDDDYLVNRYYAYMAEARKKGTRIS